MKRVLRVAATAAPILLAVCAFPVTAQDLREAVVAYDQGDYATAHYQFLSFAERGDVHAQFYLGRMYREGEGVPQDYAEAANWYRLAAYQDDAAAQNNLGLMYENGEGVRRNLELAHMWFNLSASRLSGSEKEINKAPGRSASHLIAPLTSKTTLKRDSQTGNRRERVVRNRDRVAAQLKPTALARAQRMARDWRAGRDTFIGLSAKPVADGEDTRSNSVQLGAAVAGKDETTRNNIASLEWKLGAAKADAATLSSRLREAKAGRTALLDEIAELRQALADEEEVAKTRIADLEQKLVTSRTKVGSLTAKLSDMEAARLAKQEEITRLKEALGESETTLDTLAGSLEEAVSKRPAGQKIKRLDSVVVEGKETTNKQIAAMRQAWAYARAKAAARARLLESAEAERDSQLAESVRLREALAAAEAQAAPLAERLAAVESERDAQRGEVARLEAALAEAVGEREAEQRIGESRLEEVLAEAARLRDQLAQARSRLAEAREELSRQREELQLQRGVAEGGEALTPDTVDRALFEAAEARIIQLAVENTRLRDQLSDLNAIERDSEDRIASLRQRIDEQIAEIERLEALRRALNAAREKLEADKAEQVDRLAYLRIRAEKAEAESRLARAQVARLASNIQALKEQVRRLNEALEASEAKAEGVETLVLDARLNSAPVRKIDELRRFRSEFVGQLREALAGQQLVRTEDDRFYLPAEVLFLSGSADLDRSGKERVRQIGRALTDVAARIPEGLDWVLRVDGHTDRQRLRDRSRYKTNWELSVARAIAVVKLLVESGVPAERLAATGFSEFHPLDPAKTREAFRRNRRIEFSLMRK